MSSISPLTVAQFDQHLDHGQDVFLAQNAHGVFRVEIQTHVHLDATDSRKVVALSVEEQRVEHRFGGIHRRRFARTHDAVDVEQGVLTALVLVDSQRVADVATDVDMIDVEDVDFRLARVDQSLEDLLVDFVTSFEINLAGCVIDDIFREIRTEQIVFRRLDGLEALFSKLLGRTGGQLLASFKTTSPVSASTRSEMIFMPLKRSAEYGHAPVVAVTRIGDSLVERRQNVFAVHAESHQQRRGRDLAAAVDTCVTMSLESNSMSSQEPR
jgi:hypothetical protein